MIAITFALPTESSGVLGAMRYRRNENGIIYGKLINHDVAIFHTGVGRKACQAAINQRFAAIQPALLISAGFAGGVADNLKPGDGFIAANYSDPSLVEFLSSRFQETKIKIGKLFTAESVIDSLEERAQMARENAASAVDMETAVIARACENRRIPMLSVRAISDTASQPFPLPPAVLFDLESQRTKSATIAWYLVRHPGAVPRLIRFARQIETARKSLTADICTIVHLLGDTREKGITSGSN